MFGINRLADKIMNTFKSREQNKNIPKHNDLWILNDDKSPWEPQNIPVTILDVHDGWVKYSIGILTDNRMDLKIFLRIYKLHQRD